MYLEKVRLKNIACFEDLSLDLKQQGSPCRWVVILGENGCGKSTLLQMIALALVGDETVHQIAGGVDWGRFARLADGPGRIEIEVLPTRADRIGIPPPRVFLSYSREDQEEAMELHERLLAAGMQSWIDIEEILPGEPWPIRIDSAIRDSDVVLLLLSKNTSRTLNPEIRMAVELQRERSNIFIIPVRLERCEIPDALSDLQWVDLFLEGSFTRLKRAIYSAMERRKDRLAPRGGWIAASRGALRFNAGFELGGQIRSGLRRTTDSREEMTILDSSLYSQDLTGGWFACAYGPWRRLSRTKSSREVLTTSQRKPNRFATMFEEESALTLVNDWLVDLEFRRLKDPDDREAQAALDLAVRSITKMLPGVRFSSITSEGQVLFEEAGVEVPVQHLSDGYRSTVAWIGDLVRRLVDAFPEMENPLDATGVVLVDELDLHLHPKWQRTIVEEVRELFPNLQFIVSSHSPFVAQDVGERDKIVVLKKTDGKIEAIEETENVKGWRVDQILTSYLFDLETTRADSVSVAEKEYETLLDRRARGEEGDTDGLRIRELKEWLGRHKSPPGETVAENEVFDAARSVISLIDRQLSR
jgi:energy-coupling factor transporter ATP-binding protein EcfA2